jgi:hypothetical protein
MPAFNGGKCEAEPPKPLHRRSNSQANADRGPEKIELLKTIKLPRNLK